MRTEPTASSVADKPPTTPTHKSQLSQPAELSEQEAQKIRKKLDSKDKPFRVVTIPASRKRKRQGDSYLQQTDLFEERLSCQYEVLPGNVWTRLRKYRKFTVAAESISVGQCIIVKHDATDSEGDGSVDIHEQWKAKVLEVRALDTEHVYVRVSWLNRPEDIGRKSYHGKNELIPSNEMDIIDAMTVNGAIEVVHWDEEDDESSIPEDFFWRQTLDHANSKTYSVLRQICVDEAPHNPDELILQCSEKDCRKWLHVKCIAEDAVTRAAKDASLKRKKPMKASKKQNSHTTTTEEPDPRSQASAVKDDFSADVLVKGLPEHSDDSAASKSEIIITNAADGSKNSEEVRCLVCRTIID